jgi:hypothetical protein
MSSFIVSSLMADTVSVSLFSRGYGLGGEPGLVLVREQGPKHEQAQHGEEYGDLIRLEHDLSLSSWRP